MEGSNGSYVKITIDNISSSTVGYSTKKPKKKKTTPKNIEKEMETAMSKTSASQIELLDVGRGVVQVDTPENPDSLMRSQLTEEEERMVDRLVDAIDERDSMSVMSFGITAQQKVGKISDRLIDGAKTRDLTLVQDDLKELVATANGYNPENNKPNWLQRNVLRHTYDPMKSFIDGYDTVENKIGLVQTKLMEHRADLMNSSANLDDLYHTTLTLHREMTIHIRALQKKIDILNKEIDLKNEEVEYQKANGDEIDYGIIHESQSLIRYRDNLERQKEALFQTQVMAAQDMPTLRNMKDVDEQLMRKIQQAVTHTIPLWKKKLAMIHEASKAQNAIRVMDVVGGFTDTLVVEGAKKISEMGKIARSHVEQSLTSEEALEAVNKIVADDLLEGIQLAHDGRQARLETTKKYTQMQETLIQRMLEAQEMASDYALADSSQRGVHRLSHEETKRHQKAADAFMAIDAGVIENDDGDSLNRVPEPVVIKKPDLEERNYSMVREHA